MSKSPPVFRWEQCYRIGNETHWALKDTETDADGAPARVSSSYMVLAHSDPNGFDGRPLNEQFLPALIVQLLNEHYAKPAKPDEPNAITRMRDQLTEISAELIKEREDANQTLDKGLPSDLCTGFWTGYQAACENILTAMRKITSR